MKVRLIDADSLIKVLIEKKLLTSGVLREIEDSVVYADTITYLPKIMIRSKSTDESGSKKTVRRVGEDPRHDWLQIENDGGLQYVNMQCCEGTKYGGYKFVPTFEAAEDEKYIMCRPACILERDWGVDEDE